VIVPALDRLIGSLLQAGRRTCLNDSVTNDWQRWHSHYDDPGSSLAQRLDAVRDVVRRALDEAPCGTDEVIRMTTLCAGDGRDVLPVLAEATHRRPVSAVLVELDPRLAKRARTAAAERGLTRVEVRQADAGDLATYVGVPAAHVLLACGVFGNISVDYVRRTISMLPRLVAPSGIVVWTRGAENTTLDRSREISDHLVRAGFDEMSLTGTRDGVFRIGMHRMVGPPGPGMSGDDGRMFVFS